MPYALTVFLSACLLFQMQVLLGKALLPWFGGTPAVWTTCQMGFQVLLLGGYLYAHGLVTRLTARRQAQLHGGLLLAALAVLALQAWRWGTPLLPPAAWQPAGDAPHPIAAVLGLLARTVALPFLLLAATSPLLQRWRSETPAGGQPYRLYALSNAGSLLGLLSYPFAVEPWLPLPAQAWLWSGAFALFAAGAWRCGRPRTRCQVEAPPPTTEPAPPLPRPPLRAVAAWLLLPACSTALLLGVTNALCQDIAAVPFLWVLPLALYLLTFILAFDGPRWYPRAVLPAVAALVTVADLVVRQHGMVLPIGWQIGSLTLLLTLLGLVCHGELAAARPAPSHLTLYYLLIATGGALGGVLVAVAAPLWLKGYWELPLAVLATWLTLAGVLATDRRSGFHVGLGAFGAVALLLLCHALLPRAAHALGAPPDWLTGTGGLARRTLLAAALAAGLAVALRRTSLARLRAWPPLVVAGVFLATEGALFLDIRQSAADTLATERNFFGVVRVQERYRNDPERHHLLLRHGRINHGIQFVSPERRRTATGYYGPGTGVWLAMEYHPRLLRAAAEGRPPPSLRIGVTGLGAGALAPYAAAGDTLRFYEINPAVTRLAQTRFSYLRDCQGQVEVVPGDARLAMEREWREGGSQQYDVLVLDAFSGDSVPVHLLTLEAFALYARHLRDADSLLAVNISNRFLDFRPLLLGLAERLGWEAVWAPAGGEPPLPIPSSWIVLTRRPEWTRLPDVARHARPVERPLRILWTDARSDLLRLLLVRPPVVKRRT